MTPRQGSFFALAGLVIAVVCMVPAFLMPDAEGGGVTNIVMASVFGAGIGLIVMVSGLATVARTGPRIALLGLVTVLICSALFSFLIMFFDADWLGTGMRPIAALLIVALSIGGGNLGFIVMLLGLTMAGVATLKKQSVVTVHAPVSSEGADSSAKCASIAEVR